MSRHKQDQATDQLLAEMKTTRAELNLVVDALNAQDITKGQIASAARWNAGYMSEFLGRGEKNAKPDKVGDLIDALGAFTRTHSVGQEISEALSRVAARYGRPLARLVPPTGPMNSAAANFVRIREVVQSLERGLQYNGSYAIDGQPMSGVSSTLQLVSQMLRDAGYEVCRVNVGDFVESGELAGGETGVVGALVAAITERPEVREQSHYEVHSELARRLEEPSDGFALVLDDVNRLDENNFIRLKLLLREWDTKRADLQKGFANTSVWLAFTSRLSYVRDLSQFTASYTMIRWFSREEVQSLADVLAPIVAARGTTTSARKWSIDAVNAAWYLFDGQPNLSHLYLWDRHNDGAPVDPPAIQAILKDRPTGGYANHLERIVRNIPEFVGSRAPAVVETLAASGALPSETTGAERVALERLGLVDFKGEWRNAYYKAHLPSTAERLGVLR